MSKRARTIGIVRLRRSIEGLVSTGLCLAFYLCCLTLAGAASTYAAEQQPVRLNALYVALSDAMEAAKTGDTAGAASHLTRLQSDFSRLPSHDTEQGRQVRRSLIQALESPDRSHLAAVSMALVAFEREQNPVDHSAQRDEFKRQIVPAYLHLQQVVTGAGRDDAEQLGAAYQRFQAVWTGCERLVRSTSLSHYGAIETAMALLRVAIATQPLDTDKVSHQAERLRQAIDAYNTGQSLATTREGASLADGLALLREGLSAFKTGQPALGQAKLTRFIELWPLIEGEVSTRAPALYERVEGQIPVILAHGEEAREQQLLQSLIDELEQIDPQAQYSTADAMLILLREGLEALLIVAALLSAVNVTGQVAGKRWIYAGVLVGVLASIGVALVLHQLFPVTAAGSKREMIEGIVGLFSVLMMLLVGAWLHGKSTLRAWNLYLARHMGRALTTGSLASLFGLSFLSVFREGAETILFYAAIVPMISIERLLSGIGLAVAALAVAAALLVRTSHRLPIASMFKLLTWLIYALGFKILGISLHALQLTGHVPISSLQTAALEIPALGLYPTLETLLAQAAYLALIVFVQRHVDKTARASVTKADLPVAT